MQDKAVAVVSLPARTKSEACAAIWMFDTSALSRCSKICVKKSARSVFLLIRLRLFKSENAFHGGIKTVLLN